MESRLIQTAEKDVLVLYLNMEKSGEQKVQELEKRGIRVQQVEPASDGRPNLRKLPACWVGWRLPAC